MDERHHLYTEWCLCSTIKEAILVNLKKKYGGEEERSMLEVCDVE